MIWIPDVDEIPMSVSYISKNIKGITFKKVGDATEALSDLKKGYKIGIRGPYGNGFKINGKNILFVAGGTGIAAIAPAAKIAFQKNISSTVVLGSRCKDELFFEKRFQKYSNDCIFCTDDGSCGEKGFTTDILEKIIKKQNFSSIITCGPEIMMKKIIDSYKKIPIQASLERYMKCGFGLCGQCTIGEGLRVCKEGPVFEGKKLRKIKEFGLYKKDSSGKKIRI
jgi:dihydroorotate dehydrogenase electron transfer subunit